MSPISSARVALLGASGWPLSPFDITDAYFGVFADDPNYVPPADGAVTPNLLTRGTLAASGAYTDQSLGLSVPTTAGNYASVPSSAVYDVTEIEDIECVYLSDVTPSATQYTHARFGGPGQRHIYFFIDTTGTVGFGWSTDGTAFTTISSTATLGSVGVTDGSWVWIRRRFVPNDGAGNHVLTVHYSTESHLLDAANVTWTLLGTTTTAGVTSIVTGVNYTFVFGRLQSATLNPTAIKVAYQQLNASIGGAAIIAVDFRRPITNKFTCATGQTVTVTSTFNPSQVTGSKRPLFDASVPNLNGRAAVDFDGVDDYLQIVTGVSLVQPYTVLWVGVLDSVAGAMAVVGVNSGGIGRMLGTNSTPSWRIDAGAAFAGGTPVIATPYIRRDIVDGASSNITVNAASVVSGNAGTGALDQIILGAGRTAPSTYDNYLNGRTGFAAIYPGTPTTNPRINIVHNWLAYWYNLPRLP